jgi:hypothetical protein
MGSSNLSQDQQQLQASSCLLYVVQTEKLKPEFQNLEK